MNRNILLILTAVVLLAICGTPIGYAQSNNTSTIAAKLTADALLALEKRANEAYFKGDAKFFERVLSDKFVILGPAGLRMDKAATTKMIAKVKCNVKEGWNLDQPSVSTVDAKTFVLTYKGTFDGTCTEDGNAGKVPSPIRAATVWVRSGDKWQAAFHGENVIVDPTNPAAAKSEAANGEPKKDKTAVDPSTNAMIAREELVWEAWKERHAGKLEELTSKDLSFVDIFGKVTSTKAETIKLWTELRCDVKSVSVTEGVGTLLSPAVGILTFKGTADGTCYGQKLEGAIYGTSVYVKNGDVWKLAFTFNSPD